MAKITESRLDNTEWASQHVLSLPVHPSVTDYDIEQIAHSIKNALYNV
jgi:dTDP-4-amino-4,6-dideoxygalactose transaminase